MKSKHPDLSRATRRTPLVLTLAVVLLVLLAGTVWAAWGAARSLPVGLSAWLDVDATATPTRTPRPVTVTPTPIPLELAILAPTATPLPPAPAPQPEVTPAPMPEWLAEVVQQYGMDTARRFVVIDLKTQTMFVWDPAAEAPLRELPVSTGDETRGYRTPPWYGLVGKYEGTFQSFGVYADEGWYLFEDHGKISDPQRALQAGRRPEGVRGHGGAGRLPRLARLHPPRARGCGLVHPVEPPGRAVGDPAEVTRAFGSSW